jgi:hypothetical protein
MAHRRRNPFGAGGINILAVKVGGGLVGGIAAATVPGMLGASLSLGWAGVVAALGIAFAGSYFTRSMSANFSEGILIGGTLQAAGRISQLLIKKNLVSFSMSGYGPMSFPVPTPAWSLPQAAPTVPASAAATSRSSAGSGMGYRYVGASRFAA